jgi:predicted nucleic acid-binding protein
MIEKDNWLEADRLTAGVDANDISFVALTLQKKAWLWTGDKKLIKHLRGLGFDNILTTAELYEILL